MEGRRGRGKAEKTEELRRRILDVSVELFLENGYEKTTTRQILQKAGILNGSLYNIYHGKEEIFADIIAEALDDCVKESEKLLDNPTFLEMVGFPIILEIYVSFRSPRIAEFLSVAHEKWDAMNRILDLMQRWVEAKDTNHLVDTESEDFRIRMCICLGAIGNIVEAIHRDPTSVSEKDVILILVKMLLDVFNLPTDGMESKVMDIYDAIDGNDIVVCGIHL
ncbi:MAG: TetR/AcrR family transcriptional regulator [Candidatus Methanomethylophilaceae archaeon]